MQKYLSIVLPILFLWISSCDHEESTRSDATDRKKITLTDLDHEPVVKDLLAKIQNPAANGRISTLEIADAFFKYEDSDSGILNYTFRLPDDSPDYFENLYYHNTRMVSMDLYTAISRMTSTQVVAILRVYFSYITSKMN